MERKSLRLFEKTLALNSRQDFKTVLSGKDLRTLGNSRKVIDSIRGRGDFEKLFKLMFASERPVAMRASDAVEKITKDHPEYLTGHYPELMELAKHTSNKEMKWHLAQLVTRLDHRSGEFERVWRQLTYWVRNPNESKIVRVNALQGLFDMCSRSKSRAIKRSFLRTLMQVERQREPSLLARARVLRQKMTRKVANKESSQTNRTSM